MVSAGDMTRVHETRDNYSLWESPWQEQAGSQEDVVTYLLYGLHHPMTHNHRARDVSELQLDHTPHLTLTNQLNIQ